MDKWVITHPTHLWLDPFMTHPAHLPPNNTDYVRGDASIHNMHARESFFASKTKTYEQCNYKILHKN